MTFSEAQAQRTRRQVEALQIRLARVQSLPAFFAADRDTAAAAIVRQIAVLENRIS